MMRYSLAKCAFAIVCLVLPQVVFATRGIEGSPKILNLYLDWQLREEDLPSLARWDVVVLDADQQARYPDRLRRLRELNPAIQLLAYLPAEEIALARFSEPPEYPMARLAAHIQDAWYLRDANAEKVFFWPGSPMLNVTNQGPAGYAGQRWNDFLGNFIRTEILATGLWDGIFLDNTFDGISYFAKGSIDLDRDAIAESSAQADAAWREGMKILLQHVRDQNPTAIILGNGGDAYADQLHGAVFEHFPSWNWPANWKEFRVSMARNRQPSFAAINVNTDNQEHPGAYQLMRYGLSSALIAGGLYSFDKGDANHNVLWWYDEYEASIGHPQSEPRKLGSDDVWSREFQRGLVVVNATDQMRRVPLPGIFETIHGMQDVKRNDGSIVTAVQLEPRDGVVLLRPAETRQIRGTAFRTGSFVQMFHARGVRVQNGFFASRDAMSNGLLMLIDDLDGDGRDDEVSALQGEITVRFASGGQTIFTPFGSSYTGEVSLAAGNTNRDGLKEIIVGRDGSAPPRVAVFNLEGKLQATWSAYDPAFQGGTRVAVGDLDVDGQNEIVTGPGPGGGSSIRIWNLDGSVWGSEFSAFDSSQQGGVSVAVGDVNGDGSDEIIVGSGRGAIPRVRIFSARGMLQSEFVLSSEPSIVGIQIGAADMNEDGVDEILVSGLSML